MHAFVDAEHPGSFPVAEDSWVQSVDVHVILEYEVDFDGSKIASCCL